MDKREKYFIVLSGLFTGLLVLANIIAVKLITISIGGKEFFVPAAVLAYALTFTITDSISEIWGKERTNWLVFTGFLTSVIVALLIKLAINISPAPFWQNQQQFADILGANFRITIAGMIAYLISQYHDVWSFHLLKKYSNGKMLWLRNNVSTAVSQLLDTTIFITIAFYGVIPNLTSMIISQYLIKIIIALIDTPIVYGLVYMIKRDFSSKTLRKFERSIK